MLFAFVHSGQNSPKFLRCGIAALVSIRVPPWQGGSDLERKQVRESRRAAVVANLAAVSWGEGRRSVGEILLEVGETIETTGQALYGIGLTLQDILHDVEDPELAGRLGEIRALASQGIVGIRGTAEALSFLQMTARGFLPSLRGLCDQFERATGMPVNLRAGSLPNLVGKTQRALYRMAYEALVNVDRHARATGVAILLTAEHDMVTMTIRDDGIGLDQRQARDWHCATHFGLRRMARSIQEAGGRFSAYAIDPRGLELCGVVPL